ncbi:MAG TPA: hypothetical protein VHB30_14805, partial [Solirubrobacteraceae bacterium]|nr:hypothetical protein [Solirubrobacteraceae bacterium]
MAAATLRDRHYRALLDLVGEVHDAADLTEFRSMLLPGLRRMVPADWASYNELEGPGVALATLAEPELPGWAMTAWERHAGDNPLVVRYARTRDGRAYRFSDVAARAQLERLPLFRELYAPLGLTHQIAFTLPSPVPLTMGVALSRARSASDFTDVERALLDLARPHLIQAYRNAQVRERLADVLAATQRGLDAGSGGIVLVERDGTVVLASAAARELAERLAGEQVEAGRPLGGALGTAAAGPEPVALLALPGDTLLVRRVRSGAMTVLLLEASQRVLSPAALAGLGLTG